MSIKNPENDLEREIQKELVENTEECSVNEETFEQLLDKHSREGKAYRIPEVTNPVKFFNKQYSSLNIGYIKED